MTEIRNVSPGTIVTIAEGPARGRRVKVVAVGKGKVVGVTGVEKGEHGSQTVRGSLKVTS